MLLLPPPPPAPAPANGLVPPLPLKLSRRTNESLRFCVAPDPDADPGLLPGTGAEPWF